MLPVVRVAIVRRNKRQAARSIPEVIAGGGQKWTSKELIMGNFTIAS
jgi:hypothetical protein